VIFISGQFPLVLPKLCVHTHILSPASRPFSSILVRCYLPGDEQPFAEEPIETPRKAAQNELVANLRPETSAPLYIVAVTSLVFTPIELRSSGLMRIRALVDAEQEIRLGSLRIERSPS
jgi:hypothetical protein